MIKRAIFICFIVFSLLSCKNQEDKIEETIPIPPLCTDDDITFCHQYLDLIDFIENFQTLEKFTLEFSHEENTEYYYKDGTTYSSELLSFGPILVIEEFANHKEVYQFSESLILPVLKHTYDKDEENYIAYIVETKLTTFNAIFYLDLDYVTYNEDENQFTLDIETYMTDYTAKFGFIPVLLRDMKDMIRAVYTIGQDNIQIEVTSKDYIASYIFTPNQSKQIMLPNDYAIFIEKDDYHYYIYKDEVYLTRYFTNLSYVLIPSVIDDMTVIGLFYATIEGDSVTTVELPDTIKYIQTIHTDKIFTNFKLIIPKDHIFDIFISGGNYTLDYLYIPDDDTRVYLVQYVNYPVLLERMYNPIGADYNMSDIDVIFNIKEVVEENNFIFAITKDNQAYIVKYKGSDKDIIIPGAYQSYPVVGMMNTALTGYAFDSVRFRSDFSINQGYLMSLFGLVTKDFYLPESITTIHRYDFQGTNITNLFIGQQVTHIEPYAFGDGIDLVYIPHQSAPSGFASNWDDGVIVVFSD